MRDTSVISAWLDSSSPGGCYFIGMWGLGVPELVVILVIALLVFGPSRLPEVGNFLGKSLRAFRDSMDRRDEVEDGTEKSGTEPRSDKLPPDGAA